MVIHTQVIRYTVVGLASNSALYLLYLTITALGVGHKSAMTGLYLFGILQTFIFNKRWTFAHSGATKPSLCRYLAAYGMGYILNLVMLQVFVDRLGFAHQIVQGVAVVLVAIILFLLQRYWVFATGAEIITTDSSGRTT